MLSRRGLQSSLKLCNPQIFKRQSAAKGCITNYIAPRLARAHSSISNQSRVDDAQIDKSEPLWFHTYNRGFPSVSEFWPSEIHKLHNSVCASTAALHFPHSGQQATGTVITSDGYVITCAHALEAPEKNMPFDTMTVEATFDHSDLRGDRGTVVFADYYYDIALIKFDVQHLGFVQVPKFSSLSELRGVSPYTYFGRVKEPTYLSAEHYISKKCHLIRMEDTMVDQGSTMQDLLQFETLSKEALEESLEEQYKAQMHKKNPAMCEKRNYGGPVVDDDGKVIGVLTTARRSGHEYAVPSHLIFKILRHYQKYGKVRRPYLGVSFAASDSANWIGTVVNKYGHGFETPVPRTTKAMYIYKVVPNSPADKAGLLAGDVVIQINGQWIRNSYEVTDLLWDRLDGDKVEFKVVTADSPQQIETRLVSLKEARPDSNRWYGEYIAAVVADKYESIPIPIPIPTSDSIITTEQHSTETPLEPNHEAGVIMTDDTSDDPREGDNDSHGSDANDDSDSSSDDSSSDSSSDDSSSDSSSDDSSSDSSSDDSSSDSSSDDSSSDSSSDDSSSDSSSDDSSSDSSSDDSSSDNSSDDSSSDNSSDDSSSDSSSDDSSDDSDSSSNDSSSDDSEDSDWETSSDDDNEDIDVNEKVMATLSSVQKQQHEIMNVIETQKGTINKLKWEVSRLKRKVGNGY